MGAREHDRILVTDLLPTLCLGSGRARKDRGDDPEEAETPEKERGRGTRVHQPWLHALKVSIEPYLSQAVGLLAPAASSKFKTSS